MGEQLTRRQRAIYEFVLERVNGRGIPPTLNEIATAFGLASASGVADHLKALERKGWIRRRPGISRGIEVLRRESGGVRRGVRVPLLGRVPTRDGLAVARRAGRHLWLDGRVVRGRAVAVRVDIAGLEERGILRGDLLVVREGRSPAQGDLAVARVGRAVTLVEALGQSRFRRLDTREVLEDSCEAVGTVVAVLRSMAGSEPALDGRGAASGAGEGSEFRDRSEQERMIR